jgi:hypothetical protein
MRNEEWRKKEGGNMGSDLTGDGGFRDVLASLGRTPELISEMLSRVPQSSWNAKPSKEEWSFAENLCHLRDLEREGYAVRITRMLEEETPFLPDFDGSSIAVERNYAGQDAGQALKDFAVVRANNVARLSKLDDGSLARRGTLEGCGVITLRKLMDFIHEHDQHHLGDLGRLYESLSKDGLMTR